MIAANLDVLKQRVDVLKQRVGMVKRTVQEMQAARENISTLTDAQKDALIGRITVEWQAFEVARTDCLDAWTATAVLPMEGEGV